ncbi:MAG TPA: M14 family zinc carboxypeptidase [Streptomyces sp.]
MGYCGLRGRSDRSGVSLLPELRYPTVPELVLSAGTLAAGRPGVCRLRQVGVSRAGRPLHLLSVGHARRAVLVVAGAHANEPTGGPAAGPSAASGS